MENNALKKLPELINDVEVGMILVVYNQERQSTMGGRVKKKILQHDPNTHEEQYYIELDVEGNTIPFIANENYYVFRLEGQKKEPDLDEISEKEADQFIENMDKMIDKYKLDKNHLLINSFYRMAEDWGGVTEDEREAMAVSLESFITYLDIYDMLDSFNKLICYFYRLIVSGTPHAADKEEVK